MTGMDVLAAAIALACMSALVAPERISRASKRRGERA